MTEPVLRDFVSVRGRFHRSVNLPADWNKSVDLSEYVVTDTIREIGQRVVDELFTPGGVRAWSLTGPYGSGKSAFNLFLADMLCRHRCSNSSAQELRSGHPVGRRRFVPVLLVAERRELRPLLRRELADAMDSIDSKLAGTIRELSDEATGAEFADLVVEAATAAGAYGHGGLFIAIDEFGKYLEYAASPRGETDLLFLQQLAEAATRSDVPVLLTTILHAAFADYLPVGDDLRQMEWQKVQGRYTDVAFQLPPEQLLTLVAHAIDRDPTSGYPASAYEAVVDEVLDSPALAKARKRFDPHLIVDTLPLHPLTALILWPLFRSKAAQNERSLFAFLASREPLGFQEFLDSPARGSDGQVPTYRLSNLYDYISACLGQATFRGRDARQWALVDSTLHRLGGDAPFGTARVLKSIALIDLYGDQVGLSANETLVRLAVVPNIDVSTCLKYLEANSHIVYRRHADAYALWEGSDIDLEVEYDRAIRRLSGGKLSARLARALQLEPLVARAHYIETGTLRLFERHVEDFGAPSKTGKTRRKPLTGAADGRVVFILAEESAHEDIVSAVRDRAAGLSEDELTIFGIPHDSRGVASALHRHDAWVWVNENVPGLKGDPVARREVRARLAEAKMHLGEAVGRLFGLRGHVFDPAQTTWIYANEAHEFSSSVEFQKWLSRLCTTVFKHAPILHNELLNRSKPSSAAAAARNNLLERMVTKESEAALGIEGTPPEASMYFSILREGGLHQSLDGEWQFAEPNGSWGPAWRFVSSRMVDSTSARCGLADLIDQLRRPPFGMKEGPIPVLLWAVLLAHRNEVALYEDDLFAPELTVQVIERLVRRPETFEIKSHILSQHQTAALEAVEISLLGNGSGAGDARSLLDVVKQLILFVSQLPPYARRTKRLDPPVAAAVRDSLLDARDPHSVLLKEIPDLLEIDLDTEGGPKQLGTVLRRCTEALSRSYADLLDRIEKLTRDELGLSGSRVAVRLQLVKRSTAVRDIASDPTLKLLGNELEAMAPDDDWREVVGRVVCKGRPPTHWRDIDLPDFSVAIQLLGRQFLRIEELALERGSRTSTALRIDVLDGIHKELRGTVSLDPSLEEAADTLAQHLYEELLKHSEASGMLSDVKLAALTKLAERIIPKRQEEEQGALIDV